jgi:hypothetical protein
VKRVEWKNSERTETEGLVGIKGDGVGLCTVGVDNGANKSHARNQNVIFSLTMTGFAKCPGV